jgi:Putative motility protein
VDPLAASTIAQTQAKVQGDVSIAMLKKSVDLMAQEGADLARLVSQAGGVGQAMDLQA